MPMANASSHDASSKCWRSCPGWSRFKPLPVFRQILGLEVKTDYKHKEG